MIKIMARISIRFIETTDIDILLKWRNDKEIFRYLGGGYCPVNRAKQEEIVDSMIKDNLAQKAFRYIICKDDIPIGFVGLYEINLRNGTCELGIYIGEKDEWGKGYASQAYGLVKEEAKKIGLRKIKLQVVKTNTNAVKMYQKLQFRIVGELKEERLIDEKYHDVIIMEQQI